MGKKLYIAKAAGIQRHFIYGLFGGDCDISNSYIEEISVFTGIRFNRLVDILNTKGKSITLVEMAKLLDARLMQISFNFNGK